MESLSRSSWNRCPVARGIRTWRRFDRHVWRDHRKGRDFGGKRRHKSGCLRLHFLRRCLQPIFFLFLLSQREQFHSASEGGAQPNISKVKIVWTPFPLPPLAEQHRIVAKVDELMALCNQLEASLTDTDSTRRRLLDALLAEALEPAEVREVEAMG